MGGISLVIQNSHIPVVGKSTGGLGYENIYNAVIIEYDYYCDTLSHVDNDINKPHISIHANGRKEKSKVNHKYSTTCVITDLLQYDVELTSKIIYKKLDSGLWNIRIYLQNMEMPIINEIYDLGNYIQLDSDNSCYIGLVSCNIPNINNTVGTEVNGWNYQSYKYKVIFNIYLE